MSSPVSTLQGLRATVQIRLSSGTGNRRRSLQRSESMQPNMPAQLSGVLMFMQMHKNLYKKVDKAPVQSNEHMQGEIFAWPCPLKE